MGRAPQRRTPQRHAPQRRHERHRGPYGLVAVGLGSALLLGACGGVGATGMGESDALTTMGFGIPDEIAQARVDGFEAAFPDIELQVNEGAFDAQQFLSAVASGSPPDLVYLEREKLGTYAERGALQPLNDCVADEDIDLSVFREPAVEQVTIEDQLYGLPEFNQARVLYLDTEALAEAGVDAATFSTADWSKLAQLSEQATKLSGGRLDRIGFDPKAPEFFPMWVEAAGGSIVNEDGTKATLDSDEAIEALTFIEELEAINGGFIKLKTFRDGFDVFGAGNPFAEDQLAATPFEDWYLNVLAEVSPDVPLTLKAFEDRNGEPITYLTGVAWAIPTDAKDADKACQFIKYMTSTEAWVAAAEAKKAARDAEGLAYTATWTANREADEEILATVYEPSGNAWLDDGVQLLRSLQDTGFSLPANPAGDEVNQIWTAAVNKVLEGSASPEEALRDAQEQAQQAIDQAQG